MIPPTRAPQPPPLPRRLLGEFVGTGLLVSVVAGSGIAAQHLSAGQIGLQLLENSTATVLGLGVLILMFAPVSGAHLNPLVSAADWVLGRRSGTGLSGADAAAYTGAQVLGGIGGAVLANAMFDLRPLQTSSTDRITSGHLISEIVATAGLITLIFALARTGRSTITAPAVGAYIGAAYWFTSSTSFANPAVTIARVFTDTFAGIAPGSAAAFIAAQTIGALLGCALVVVLHPVTTPAASNLVAPSHSRTAVSEGSSP